MMQRMFRGAGRLALWLATMALLTGVSLFVIGSFLLTWPILRLSPRERRIKASVDFASSGITLLTAFSEQSIRQALDTDTDQEASDDDERT